MFLVHIYEVTPFCSIDILELTLCEVEKSLFVHKTRKDKIVVNCF